MQLRLNSIMPLVVMMLPLPLPLPLLVTQPAPDSAKLGVAGCSQHSVRPLVSAHIPHSLKSSVMNQKKKGEEKTHYGQ
jgi:hypothetical protein